MASAKHALERVINKQLCSALFLFIHDLCSPYHRYSYGTIDNTNGLISLEIGVPAKYPIMNILIQLGS